MLQWLLVATPMIWVGLKQPFDPTCPHSLIPKCSHLDCFGKWHFTCVSSSLFCVYLSKQFCFFHHHIAEVEWILADNIAVRNGEGALPSLFCREWTKILRLTESFKENRYHCWILMLKCLSLYLPFPFFLCPCRSMPEFSMLVAPLDCYQEPYSGSGNSFGIPSFIVTFFARCNSDF